MATQKMKQPIVASVQTEFGGKGRTHISLEVTKTATMENGSLLVAAGTEAAIADVALATMVIDAPLVDFLEVGEVALVSVAVREGTVKVSDVKFSDAGALVPANATALIAAGFIFV